MGILGPILIADFAFTLLHSYQEWKGPGAPLWRNFGAIVGLEIPDRYGFLLFTVGLTLVLLVLGFVGIVAPLGDSLTAFALGALIGARLSDTLVSHLLLHSLGYRPNPGLSSTPLYVIEAFFLAWAFHERLWENQIAGKLGLTSGVAFFIVVLPALKLAWYALPSLRRTPWQRGQPMPAWATRPPDVKA
jgi:hypothetical protein